MPSLVDSSALRTTEMTCSSRAMTPASQTCATAPNFHGFATIYPSNTSMHQGSSLELPWKPFDNRTTSFDMNKPHNKHLAVDNQNTFRRATDDFLPSPYTCIVIIKVLIATTGLLCFIWGIIVVLPRIRYVYRLWRDNVTEYEVSMSEDHVNARRILEYDALVKMNDGIDDAALDHSGRSIGDIEVEDGNELYIWHHVKGANKYFNSRDTLYEHEDRRDLKLKRDSAKEPLTETFAPVPKPPRSSVVGILKVSKYSATIESTIISDFPSVDEDISEEVLDLAQSSPSLVESLEFTFLLGEDSSDAAPEDEDSRQPELVEQSAHDNNSSSPSSHEQCIVRRSSRLAGLDNMQGSVFIRKSARLSGKAPVSYKGMC